MTLYLAFTGKCLHEGEGYRVVNCCLHILLNAFEYLRFLVLYQPVLENLHRVPLGPLHFLFTRTVRAVDIANMMSVEAVGIADKEGRPAAFCAPGRSTDRVSR